jgi:hypothetical protein
MVEPVGGINMAMNDAVLQFPQWRIPLQELIFEFDPQKLPEKIRHVETLILDRLCQVDDEYDSRVEEIALDDALRIVRILKRGKVSSSSPGIRNT